MKLTRSALNPIVTPGKPIYTARDNASLDRKGFSAELNVFYDITGQAPFSGNQQRDEMANNLLTRK